MHMIGSSAAIATFRYDLVFLHASLLADERPDVNALAPRVAAKLAEIRSERDAFELAGRIGAVAYRLTIRDRRPNPGRNRA
jgi:hypothetical protein